MTSKAQSSIRALLEKQGDAPIILRRSNYPTIPLLNFICTLAHTVQDIVRACGLMHPNLVVHPDAPYSKYLSHSCILDDKRLLGSA
jgi:hypothetical protein